MANAIGGIGSLLRHEPPCFHLLPSRYSQKRTSLKVRRSPFRAKLPGSSIHRISDELAPGPEADALAQVAVGQLGGVGDVGAGGLHARDDLGDRLKVGAEMDR